MITDSFEFEEQSEEEYVSYIDNLKYVIANHLLAKQRSEATEKIVNHIMLREYVFTTRDDIKTEVWIYKNGIYIPQGKSYIQEYCREILGQNYTSQICNIVISKIETDTYIDSKQFFETNYIDEIPVTNGVLNIRTRTISSFNPKKIFFNKLPLVYDSTAKCPDIIKFFKDVLKSEDDSKVIFEIFGYCLLKEYKYEKAFMLVGGGRNGKSKSLTLLKKFVGAENCCSIPLTQINPQSTSVCELHSRLINLAGDLSSSDLRDTGTIKQVTGRDLINAKRKFLRDLIFVNYAKMVFACNELPKVYDLSEGFWSRWVLLEFPYEFVNEKEYDEKNPKLKIRDEGIIDKISNEKEMSGLLNEALNGLDRLKENHDFSYTKGTKEIKDIWIRQADSFKAFCLDHVLEDHNAYTSKKDIRKYFSKYCRKHKIKGAGDKGIKATLEDVYGVIEIQKGTGEERERIWDGIRLNNLDILKKGETRETQGF